MQDIWKAIACDEKQAGRRVGTHDCLLSRYSFFAAMRRYKSAERHNRA